MKELRDLKDSTVRGSGFELKASGSGLRVLDFGIDAQIFEVSWVWGVWTRAEISSAARTSCGSSFGFRRLGFSNVIMVLTQFSYGPN